MWSKGPYNYKGLPSEDLNSQSPASDESGHGKRRGDHSASQQHEYKHTRENFRRKCHSSSHYLRERSPYKRDAYLFRTSSVAGKDFPHSQSGSSRRQYPKQSKPCSSHRSKSREPEHVHASCKWQNEGKLESGRERPVQSSKPSRDTSSSRCRTLPLSKALDKPSRTTEKEFTEVTNKWDAEKLEASHEGNWPEISEFEIKFTGPPFIDQPEEPESKRTDSTRSPEHGQLTDRLKSIASKTREIEQAFQRDCETFGMVVQMLIEKQPSLEKTIQLALRQNLRELSEQCVQELRHFIEEYDASTRDGGEP
uniref:periphilin-1-like n=1 Tax=Jaculus jaculus TaxID=51337 RepID=UPI001E1B25E1|nr:periphilin-1-like [Jaculus jaculus]